MSRPTLYVFAISHYCEKARWGLDALGADYELRHLPPGAHLQITSELGAAGSSLPLLVSGDLIVHGSSAILDWVDTKNADPSLRLAPDAEFAEACRALEERLDDIVGVHVRRYYYSEAMVEHPESVRPIFTRDLEASERQAVEESWAIVRQVMIDSMDLGAEQGRESRLILETEFDWFDALLADGRRYLVGDRFSRADITAASLLAALALPEEHPTYGLLEVPPRVSRDLERWSRRPTAKWVGDIYRDHRWR